MQKQGVGISADYLAKSIWRSLCEDFRLKHRFEHSERFLKDGDLPSFRNSVLSDLGIIDPLRFKQFKQLENLLKKYRFFDGDVYTNEELEEVTNKKYLSTQIRLSSTRLNKPHLAAERVLREARKITLSILGRAPNVDDVERLCRFGKKSSIGCPLRLAYIDHKLTDGRAFTGSATCASWFFKNVLPKDPLLDRIVQRLRIKPGHKNLQHSFLKLENVPKTWKVHRGITPLTLIDLFFTYGVGGVVTEKLKEHGLDIRFLQDKHRHVLRRFSQTCTHVTADLSAASDSITSDLLNKVLPRAWYKLIRQSTTHQVQIGDRLFYTESVLPMGNGLTFPVETLVFYSITKAIGNLTGTAGLYSVFGDDLIYPRQIHPYVVNLFPKIGFELNKDKTFSSYPFRESCGEDYYRGIPVRSFYLSTPSQGVLKGHKLEAYVYAIINGLLRRWDEHEISITLNFLLQILSVTTFRILRVPPSFPDTSGVKVLDPSSTVLNTGYIVPWEPVYVNFSHGSRWYRFQYLKAVAEKRFIKFEEPYYWQRLSGDTDEPSDDWSQKFSIYSESPVSPIAHIKEKKCITFMQSGRKRKRVIWKMIPYVSSRVIERYVLQSNTKQSCSDWI